jgi:tungstate transport system substrate-binding protein
MRISIILCFFLALLHFGTHRADASTSFITIASEEGLVNSGLFNHLFPAFEKEFGIEVRVIAAPVQKAVDLTMNAKADAMIINNRITEQRLKSFNFIERRFEFLRNDILLIGDGDDPAKIMPCISPANALLKIYRTGSPFRTADDNPNVLQREIRIWRTLNINYEALKGEAFFQTSQIISDDKQMPYRFIDQANWHHYLNTDNAKIFCEGHDFLKNPYAILTLNIEKYPRIKDHPVHKLIDWLRSSKAQELVKDYQKNGHSLFTPLSN